MSWEKLGMIYRHREGSEPLLRTYAANPLAMHLNENVYRVFFSGRDADNKSSVGFADIDIIAGDVRHVSEKALVKYGEQDSFYSHGISIGNLYKSAGRNYILFMGWNIPEGSHWRGDIGRLELMGNDILEVTGPAPHLGTDKEDLVSLSYPFVVYHEGIYKMWYGSTVTWDAGNGEMLHVIKYATSNDAETWVKHGIAVPFELGTAQAFSRPSVIIDGEGYHMWYSFRSGDGTKYRIGYARSEDGTNWKRCHNETGIDVSSAGWDSEMICYPFVFDHGNERYMLYNGNSFGKEGFGLAKWKK